MYYFLSDGKSAHPVCAPQTQRRQARTHTSRAARSRTQPDPPEGLRADDAGERGETGWHDHWRDLWKLQEPRRALYRSRPGLLGADQADDLTGRDVRRGHARAREGHD